MLDAMLWKRDGEGEKVVRNGGPDGPLVKRVQVIFYRHRMTNQLKIIHKKVPC